MTDLTKPEKNTTQGEDDSDHSASRSCHASLHERQDDAGHEHDTVQAVAL